MARYFAALPKALVFIFMLLLWVAFLLPKSLRLIGRDRGNRNGKSNTISRPGLLLNANAERLNNSELYKYVKLQLPCSFYFVLLQHQFVCYATNGVP